MTVVPFITGPRPRQRRSFTLVELLISITIAGFVGLTVVMMLSGVASAVDRHHTTERTRMRSDAVVERLGSTIRSACTVLTLNNQRMLLWTADTTGNGKPNLSELKLVTWSSSAKEIAIHAATSTPQPDTAYALTADFDAVATSIAATFPRVVCARDISAWSTVANTTPTADASIIRVKLTVQGDTEPESVTVVAALLGSR